MAYTTEQELKDAQKYITDNGITDEDEKQTLYLIAISDYLDARNNGFKYQFGKYLNRKSARDTMNKYLQEPSEDYIEDKRVDIEDVYYVPQYIINGTDAILYSISSLTKREQRVLYERFVNNLTLEQVGRIYGVTKDRIRQIEAKALRKLRHPYRSKNIKQMLDYDNINFPDFDEKFREMLKDEYKPVFTPTVTKEEYNDENNREKIIFTTGTEVTARKREEEEEKRKEVEKQILKSLQERAAKQEREKQDRERKELLEAARKRREEMKKEMEVEKERRNTIIHNTVVQIENTPVNNPTELFYFNPNLTDLSMINDAIVIYNYRNNIKIPKLFLMMSTMGIKHFRITYYCNEYNLYAYIDNGELVITAVEAIKLPLQIPNFKDSLDVILKFIVTYYDYFK